MGVLNSRTASSLSSQGAFHSFADESLRVSALHEIGFPLTVEMIVARRSKIAQLISSYTDEDSFEKVDAYLASGSFDQLIKTDPLARKVVQRWLSQQQMTATSPLSQKRDLNFILNSKSLPTLAKKAGKRTDKAILYQHARHFQELHVLILYAQQKRQDNIYQRSIQMGLYLALAALRIDNINLYDSLDMNFQAHLGAMLLETMSFPSVDIAHNPPFNKDQEVDNVRKCRTQIKKLHNKEDELLKKKNI